MVHKLNNFLYKNEPSDFLGTSMKYTSHVKKVNVKWPCYRPGVAQSVGRGIALEKEIIYKQFGKIGKIVYHILLYMESFLW